MLTTVNKPANEKQARIIERGLSTFRDVGSALLAIRDSKLYRAARSRRLAGRMCWSMCSCAEKMVLVIQFGRQWRRSGCTRAPNGWTTPICGPGGHILVEAIIRNDAEALALWHEAMASKRGRKPKEPQQFVDNINELDDAEPREKGTSRAYTLSRLKKQRPDLVC